MSPTITNPPSHDDLPDVSADDHHAQDHAARHADGGADEIDVADLGSTSTTDAALPVADGAGGVGWKQFQAFRSSQKSLVASSSATYTEQWPEAWPDTNYSVNVTVARVTGTGSVGRYFVTSRTTTHVTVSVENTAAVGSADFVIHIWGVGD